MPKSVTYHLNEEELNLKGSQIIKQKYLLYRFFSAAAKQILFAIFEALQIDLSIYALTPTFSTNTKIKDKHSTVIFKEK